MKRRSVLNRDRLGSYIPVCTRNVFLKYYTDAEEHQMLFWGQHDREHYLARCRHPSVPTCSRTRRRPEAGYLTSYAGLFAPPRRMRLGLASIEIPLIQRDYAQGRSDPRTPTSVRVSSKSCMTRSPGEPVGLDFVYGNIEDGTFRPLDGQQRLTTLFLLHWYLASARRALRAAGLDPLVLRDPAERSPVLPAARDRQPASRGEAVPSAWITDQSWYLYAWRNDPTIQAMLVMIDAIHQSVRRLRPPQRVGTPYRHRVPGHLVPAPAP